MRREIISSLKSFGEGIGYGKSENVHFNNEMIIEEVKEVFP